MIAHALALLASAAYAAWTPPAGIPAPPFGIEEEAGAPTHYVDSLHPQATDVGNPAGTAARPRKTVPGSLPAGAVVEVRGGPYSMESGWSAAGERGRPVFIKGVGRPVFRGELQARDITGNYAIIEGLVFDGLALRLRGGNLVLRRSEVRNFSPKTNGEVISPKGTDIVIWDNHIHHNGDVAATYDLDIHAIRPDTGALRVWILDNRLHHNAGDSIQLANASSPEPWPARIYIGRNEFHEDRQGAVGIKRARDVVISQNKAWGYRRSSSSQGTAFYAQYDATRVWYVGNEIRDSEHAFWTAETVSGIYALGNLMRGIRSSAHRPGDPFSGGSAALSYARGVVYAHNTVWDCDEGIWIQSGGGGGEAVANLAANLRPGAKGVGVHPNVNGAVFARNLIGGDPRLANPAGGDFRPAAGSPAIDAGAPHPAYELFRSLYGIDLAAALDRPKGGGWDVGAFEHGSSGSATGPRGGTGGPGGPQTADRTPPSAPGAPSYTQSGDRTVFSWGASSDSGGLQTYELELAASPSFSPLLSTGRTLSLGYTLSGLRPNMVYYARVRAIDKAGNRSAPSEAVSFLGPKPAPAAPAAKAEEDLGFEAPTAPRSSAAAGAERSSERRLAIP